MVVQLLAFIAPAEASDARVSVYLGIGLVTVQYYLINDEEDHRKVHDHGKGPFPSIHVLFLHLCRQKEKYGQEGSEGNKEGEAEGSVQKIHIKSSRCWFCDSGSSYPELLMNMYQSGNEDQVIFTKGIIASDFHMALTCQKTGDPEKQSYER